MGDLSGSIPPHKETRTQDNTKEDNDVEKQRIKAVSLRILK